MSPSIIDDSMVQVQGLTAETLLEFPRRSPAVANRLGTHAISSFSHFDFEKTTIFKDTYVVDLKTGRCALFSGASKGSNFTWMPGSDNEVVWFRSEEEGETSIVVTKAGSEDVESYDLKRIKAPINALRLKKLDNGGIALAFTGLVGPDGQPFNEKLAKRKGTGRIYDSANIRLWEEYYKDHYYSLFYTQLVKENDKWAAPHPLHNLLQDTTLEPFGVYGQDDPLSYYDICNKGIAFIARNTVNRDYSKRLFNSPYFVSLDSFTRGPTKKPSMIHLPAALDPGGISENIRFSPDESGLAYLFGSDDDPYNIQLYGTSTLTGHIEAQLVETSFREFDSGGNYNPPDNFEFLGQSNNLVLHKRLHGRAVLEYVNIAERKSVVLRTEGSVQAFSQLNAYEDNKLLVTSTSFIDNSLWQIVDVSTAEIISTIASNTKNGRKFGLSKSMISEMWMRGAEGALFHSWVIVPSTFDPRKKYPWIVSLHGGPISASCNAWNLRWNETLWAEQGFVVVCPNFTGSIGFGIDYIRRISDHWGGRPYEDVVKLVEHLETLPYLDPKKAIIQGASYGAYLVGVILGRDLARKFCCAIWHNGIFNMPTFCLQTDYPPDNLAFGFRPPFAWNNMASLDKWNPARPDVLQAMSKYAPPTLVMHGEKDYRCPMTEGIALFNSLQAQGVPSRFLTFEDEGHWVMLPDNLKTWYETAWDWSKRCINGEITRESKNW